MSDEAVWRAIGCLHDVDLNVVLLLLVLEFHAAAVIAAVVDGLLAPVRLCRALRGRR